MNRKLKELREKRGLSQADVAAFIGISRQMYNKYESGDVDPSLKAIKAICTLYAISYEELLSEEPANKESLSAKAEAASQNASGTNNNNISYATHHKNYSFDSNNSTDLTNKNNETLSVASPTPAYNAASSQNQMYGTTNVLSQILELLPKLLYSEKAKLLTTVAQSMSNDVEAGQLASRNRPERLNHEEPKQPSYEEFSYYFEENKKLMKTTNFNTKGIKWTREEMHER